MLTNLPKRDDEQWMKHTTSRLNAKHVEDATVVLEYREAHSQSDLRLTTRSSNRGGQWRRVEIQKHTFLPKNSDDKIR